MLGTLKKMGLLAVITVATAFGMVMCGATEQPELADSDLLIAAFNIQIFGKSKVGKKDVVDVLCKILSRYDLVGILEIRDSSQTAFAKLVNNLNEFVGEQITGKLDIVSMYERFDEYDTLEREPTVVKFRRVHNEGFQKEFTFIPIHIKPDDAVNEMNDLVDVCEEAERIYGPDIIVAGDLNADCSYVCQSCWGNCLLRNDPKYQWLIPDDADTTTKRTDCAYDRIILKGDRIQSNACCARVYKYDEEMSLEQELAEEVSDHYPVEFVLS